MDLHISPVSFIVCLSVYALCASSEILVCSKPSTRKTKLGRTKYEEQKSSVVNPMGKILIDDDIQNLNFIIGANKLEKLLEVWKSNKTNSNEEFWQKEFENNPWLISQIFACPYVFIEGKPFFGGKKTNNKGGVYGDMLYKNIKTNNAAFIEIKTPETPLLKNVYRGIDSDDSNTVYSIHEEISGGIVQILNQRSVQLQNSYPLRADYENFNSKCIFIAGNTEKLNQAQLKSFDLFRSSNKDVEIIAFDELFEKIEIMKNIFQNDDTSLYYDEEVPKISLEDDIPEIKLEDVPF